MRKAQKQEVLNCINSLHQAHKEIKETLNRRNYDTAQNMLSECQEFAVTLGESIEDMEGEGCITVSYIEEYCEALFRVFEEINNGKTNENRLYKILNKQLLAVENSVKDDITVKKEVAFFPYKASMWDSLESVYLAAKEDPECDAYCVPIPYYDLNPDHSFGKMHYEGNEYPEDIEIIDWQSYNFEERKPDVIYIHNPYDNYNLVTSVHPRYYSSNLKKYTDTLVYIPYYVTSGGMLEAQCLLPAYLYVDYIVIQSPQFREYFDKSIPDEKFLPFGSPKVDKVINKCKNPPEPSEVWIEKMTDRDGGRKRVIFYNTGISAMLKNTEVFLKKMEYVFKCFMGREDVCLLWRPHPLLETTFDSMRPEFRPVYDALKKVFVENNLGIYDTTSDIEGSIALSDAYIGDAGTSVISLFGVAGKPIFILNNQILEEPREEDWRREISAGLGYIEQGRFTIIQGNKLYVSEPNQYDYHYFCELSEDMYEKQYFAVCNIRGKWYACPSYAQEILKIGEKGIEKRIELKRRIEKGVLFGDAWKYDRYLLLIPVNYPSIVCVDTITEKIRYYDIDMDVFLKDKRGQNAASASLIYQGALYVASHIRNSIFKLCIESGETETIELPIQSRCGCASVLVEYRQEIWLLPYEGEVIVCWNPLTGEVREYTGVPQDFECVNPISGEKCMERPFGSLAFYGDEIYLTPRWSNMYLKLNIQTGIFSQWCPNFEREGENKAVVGKSMFLGHMPDEKTNMFRIYSYSKRKLYDIDLNQNICQEIAIQFNMEELKKHEPGFCKFSEKLRYACMENYFNSLKRFLSGKTVGKSFDRAKQIEAYKVICSNSDGTCGQKIYDFLNKCVENDI